MFFVNTVKFIGARSKVVQPSLVTTTTSCITPTRLIIVRLETTRLLPVGRFSPVMSTLKTAPLFLVTVLFISSCGSAPSPCYADYHALVVMFRRSASWMELTRYEVLTSSGY